MTVKRSPSALSLAMLRAEGYTAEVVERRHTSRLKTDLFGFIDIVAIRRGETLAVQTTDTTNVAARVRKIAEAPLVGAVREAGWRIVVHGWYPDGRVREVDCS